MSDSEYIEQAYELLELGHAVVRKHSCLYAEAINTVIASRQTDEQAVLAYAALFFSAKKHEQAANILDKQAAADIGAGTATQMQQCRKKRIVCLGIRWTVCVMALPIKFLVGH